MRRLLASVAMGAVAAAACWAAVPPSAWREGSQAVVVAAALAMTWPAWKGGWLSSLPFPEGATLDEVRELADRRGAAMRAALGVSRAGAAAVALAFVGLMAPPEAPAWVGAAWSAALGGLLAFAAARVALAAPEDVALTLRVLDAARGTAEGRRAPTGGGGTTE